MSGFIILRFPSFPPSYQICEQCNTMFETWRNKFERRSGKGYGLDLTNFSRAAILRKKRFFIGTVSTILQLVLARRGVIIIASDKVTVFKQFLARKFHLLCGNFKSRFCSQYTWKLIYTSVTVNRFSFGIKTEKR